MKSQLEISTMPGKNHTGLALHADQLKAMVDGAREFPPTSSGSAKQIDDLRIRYAVTPCASLQATASRGIGDVLLDPRTSFLEGLETILIAELADHESWGALARSVEPFGDAALIKKVQAAQKTELEHLTKIRRWIEAATPRHPPA